MKIEIKKAGIRNFIFLAYEYTMETDGVTAKNKTQSTAPIHDDLKAAFTKLIPHFILLTEELPENQIKGIIENDLMLPEDIEKKYGVTDFELSGSEDSQTIKITGYKILSNDKSVSFSTPSQKLYEDKTDGYGYDNFLREAVDVLLNEVQEYMDGKQAPRMLVGKLDFGDDDDEAFTMPSVEEFGENLGHSLAESLGEGVEVTVSSNGKSKTIKGKKKGDDIDSVIAEAEAE